MRQADHSLRHHQSSERSLSSSKDSSKRGHRSSEREVDVYRSPTRLFELIDAGDDDAAIRWVTSHPAEASTWLVSRRGKRDDARDEHDVHERDGRDDDGVKWRYLPLHLACLRPSPSLPLVRSLLETYGPAVRRRDRAGNLPVHYVCLEGTENDWEVLEFLLDAYPESLHKESGDGRTLTQLVQDMSNSDEGSLATNGTMVARVSDFDRRRRERGGGHGRSHNQQEHGEHQRRGKSRSKSRGRSRLPAEEGRDQPPRLPPRAAEADHGYSDARRFECQGSGSVKSSCAKRRSKSRRRGVRRDDAIVEKGGDDNEELCKRIRDLEGKLDAALTERDVLSDSMEEIVSKDKERAKEVKDLKRQLDAVLHDAEEDKRVAEAEHRRVDELEQQLREGDEQREILRGRVKELDQSKCEMEQSKLEKEKELAMALNDARSEATENTRRVKAEALEVERGLRDKIDSLEKELKEKRDTEERYNELVQQREAEAKSHSALQLMNSSLQDQIISMKTKCNNLERKLKEATNERDTLQARLDASPPSKSKSKQDSRSELGERQKRLHKEFNSLWSALQSMSKDNPGMAKILSGDGVPTGDSVIAAESLAQSMQVMTAENMAREEKIKSYRAKLDELERENVTLREEAKRANKERLELEAKVRHVAKEEGDDARQMLAYEAQIKELQAKNKSLRDKITKNNETYVAKVEELGEECARLDRDGDGLRQTVQELRAECDEHKKRLQEETRSKTNRDGSGGHELPSIDASKRADLSKRVASVATFLIKISDMQERIVSYATRMENEMQAREVRRDQVLTAAERGEMEAMAKAAKERGVLLNNAVAIQKRELEAIATEINFSSSPR